MRKNIDENVIELDDNIIGGKKVEDNKAKDKKAQKEFKKQEIKTKIQRFVSFYDFRRLIGEIKTLGYSISMNTLGIILLAIVLLSFICSVLLKVKVQYLIALGVMLIACLPYAILMTFTARYEEKRFNSIVGYMEQLIYAFHKSGKIRDSLVDVLEVSTGNIKRTIQDMMNVIDNDDTTSKIYEKAFAIMDNRYNCTRLKIIHNYLVSVEVNGGDPSVSLKILLEDLRAWVERVGIYQAERKNVKVKTAISICCALLSCGIMINLVPSEYVEQIVEYTVYQLGTVVVLGLNIIVFMVSCTQLSMSYLDNEIDKKYNYTVRQSAKFLANWGKKNHIKTSIIKACMVAPVLIASIVFHINILVLVSALIMFMFLTHDFTYKASCLKRVTREIKKAFPIWLRGLILHLQVDNVHVAIRNSYNDCPEILKPELESFMSQLAEDPVSMKPYNNFLGAYEVPDLKLASHYLYSIATFGTEDVLSQLDYLIEQTGKLEIVEEKLRNEDSIATFSLIILTPMLLAVIKLMIDLVLFINIFIGYLNAAF